jgi:hypothetical protein
MSRERDERIALANALQASLRSKDERVVGMTAGLLAVAKAIEDLAEAVNITAFSADRIADHLDVIGDAIREHETGNVTAEYDPDHPEECDGR